MQNLPNDLINNDIITMGYNIAEGNYPVCLRETLVECGTACTQTYQGLTNDNELHVNSRFDQGIRSELLERNVSKVTLCL